MKKFFKALAVLVLIVHVFAVLIYMGILPVEPFTGFRLPDAGRLAEFFLRMNEDTQEEEAALVPEEEEQEQKAPAEAAEPAEEGEETTEGAEGKSPDAASEAREDDVSIELSEPLPEITEDDLYDLSRVLTEAGVLRAYNGRGEDCSDRIFCELAADIEDPGHFTAVFSVQSENGQIERGPSADMRVDLTAPFLAFREEEVTITAGTDYDPSRNILICMDVDGTVLTEFVARDGSLNTDLPGDYEITFYIYSRVNGSSAFRNMTVHVEEAGQ